MNHTSSCPHANPVTLSPAVRERLGIIGKVPMKTARGALTECRYPTGHHGPHRSATGYETWDQDLSEDEMDFAEELRARVQK
ncbi:hypothetical protein EDF62_1513 [Leucobacter luti]|uniref:Uncharacterized protein n=2 Tax=Leucobacter luti TaxID=340320 RepID=A0A4V3CY08_9MICO|nr:hypothetical protein EDF62_1513 [Leucobacter luti]